MFGQTGSMEVGSVTVTTTSGKGLDVEWWTERCLDKLVQVADDSESVIAEQARMFKDQIRLVLVHYLKQAIKSDRTSLYNLLLKQGEREMAELLRKEI